MVGEGWTPHFLLPFASSTNYCATDHEKKPGGGGDNSISIMENFNDLGQRKKRHQVSIRATAAKHPFFSFVSVFSLSFSSVSVLCHSDFHFRSCYEFTHPALALSPDWGLSPCSLEPGFCSAHLHPLLTQKWTGAWSRTQGSRSFCAPWIYSPSDQMKSISCPSPPSPTWAFSRWKSNPPHCLSFPFFEVSQTGGVSKRWHKISWHLTLFPGKKRQRGHQRPHLSAI